MSRTSWLNKHLTPSSSRNQRRRQTAQKRRPVRLAVEPLEDRLVLSTVVTDGHELATAINANNVAGGNITLTLANSFTLQNNSSHSVEISKGSVTIVGNGNTLTAAATSRLFQVDKGASLTIDNAVLTGGDVRSTFFGTAKGGAILDLGGNVTLSGGAVVESNSVVANSPVSGVAEGGGVFVSLGGSLTIKGSVIQNNSAVGAVNITSVVGHASNSAEGGGVYLSGGSTLSVTGGTITGNLAQGSNAIITVGPGGVVVPTAGFAAGGGVYLVGTAGTPSKATLTGSIVSGNTAQGGVGATPVTVTNGNPTTGDGTTGGGAYGGGIFAFSSSLSLTGTLSPSGTNLIGGNKALGGQGGDAGIPTLFSAGFTGGGGGSAFGGGIDDVAATGLLIKYTSFTSNTAQGGMGGMGGNGASSAFFGHDGGGGGVGGSASGGSAFLSISSGVLATLVNSSITGSSAIGGTGGKGGTGGSGTLGNGANGATGAGGSATGGGVAISGAAGSLTNVINTTVATDRAQGGGSAAGFGSGGGIWFSGAGSMQLINDTVYSNSVSGGGVYTSTFRPGGVQATATGAGSVTAYNTLFLNNTNPNGYADTNIFLPFGLGDYVTTSFAPTIKVVSTTPSFMDGLTYYALESGTAAVNGGVGPTFAITGGTLAKVIAGAEGVAYNPIKPADGVTDEIGQPRFHDNGIFGFTTDSGAVSFQINAPAPSPASTTVTVGNVNITTSNLFTPLVFTATVTATSGNPVTEGLVTFTVTDSKGNVVGAPVPSIMTGPGTWSTTTLPALATTYILPGNTPPGTYFITASYSDPYNPAGTAITPPTHGLFGSSNNSANPGLLTISAPAPTPTAPVITKEPDNATVVAGSTVLFTAAATGVPAPTVQWFVSTDGGKTFTAISGATTGTLTLTNVTTSMSGYEYEAVFTNASGSATTTAALLTVTPSTVAPTVTLQPTGQSVVAGNTAVFTAGATGTPTPTVQWYVSTDGGATYTSIAGATSTTLTVANTTTAMNNNLYRAVFTNSVGTATTNSALLHVTSATVAPTVTLNPVDHTATAGDTVLFTAAATGTPTPTVQWQVSANGGTTFTSVPGATSNTLTLTDVTTAMSGEQYRAVFTNSAGTATTTAALLTVNAATVAPTITLQPKNVTATVGNPAVFTASATGNPTPTVQWFLSTDGGKTFASIAGATSTTLTVPPVGIGGNGWQFRAVFTNSAGTATTNAAQLTVVAAVPTVNVTGNVGVTNPVNANVVSVNGTPVVTPSNPLLFALEVALDTAALLMANNATAVSQLNAASQTFLGQPLPPTSALLSTIMSDLHQSVPIASFGMQLGYSLAGILSSMDGGNQ
jgi:hypothetical protein